MKDRDILVNKRQFMGRWLSIESKMAEGRIIPFNKPTVAQKQALAALEDDKVKLVVFLKSRQVYMSTVVAGSTMHDHCAARGPLRTMVACDHGDTTDSLLRKYKTFSEHLPERIARQLAIRVNHNKREIHWDRNGGTLKLATVGGSSLAKSQTYNHLVAEEMGFWPHADEAWASITAAVGGEGRKVIISTPNGPGNLYHRQVDLAYKADKIDKNPAVKFFFWPWFDHPEYALTPPDNWQPREDDLECQRLWNLTTAQTYWRHWRIHGPEGIGISKFRKYFPSTMEEGFLHYEGGWFNTAYLNELIGIHHTNQQQGGLRVYEEPDPSMSYAIGVDPAWCNGGHYAAAVVLDETGSMAAVLSTKEGGIKRFAERVSRLAGVYNDARILCESNTGGGGSVVIDILRSEGCRLWKDKKNNNRDFHTNSGSKLRIYEHARQMINGYALTIPDVQVLRELVNIREKNGSIGNPRRGAGDKDDTKDDHADALVLAEWNRRTLPRGGRPTPSSYRPQHSISDNPHAAVRQAQR